MLGQRVAVLLTIRFIHDDASGVGRIFERLSAHAGQRILAAGGFERMRIDNRIPPIQFIEDRIECFVTEPLVVVAGQERNAIDLQRVVGIFDFLERALDVRHRQRCEKSVPAFEISNHLRRGIFVQLASRFARFLHIAEPDSRRCRRKHGGCHTRLVHLVDVSLRRVISKVIDSDRIVLHQQIKISRRGIMLMDVDPLLSCLRWK